MDNTFYEMLMSMLTPEQISVCKAYVIEQIENNRMCLGNGPFQTLKICLAAVKQYGFALELVKEQTPAICLAAVKQNGNALKFVKEQTKEICDAAVAENPDAAKHIKI